MYQTGLPLFFDYALVALLCFFQRSAMAWGVPKSFDTWGHIYFVTAVKRQNTGPFSPIKVNAPGADLFNYPLFSHWILSKLPESMFRRWANFVVPAIESLFLVVFLIISHFGGVNGDVVISAGLIYVFTPMLFSKISLGPVSQFSTRSFSELVISFLILTWILPLNIPPMSWMVLVAVIVQYVALASKFGLQVIVLVIFPASVLAGDIIFLSGLVIGVAVAILLTRGTAIQTWREQIQHLRWYYSEVRKGNMPVRSRNNRTQFSSALKVETLKKKLTHLVYAIFATNSFTATAIKFPALLFAGWFTLNPYPIEISGGTNFVAIMVVATIVFVLVNTTNLIFLGEAERYFTHMSFPIILAMSQSIFIRDQQWMFQVLLLWGLLVFAVEFVGINLLKFGKGKQEGDIALRIMKERFEVNTTVLSWPYHILPPWRLLADRTFRPIFPIVTGGEPGKLLRSVESYPYIDLNALSMLREQFGLSVIVVEAEKLTSDHLKKIVSDNWVEVVDSRLSKTMIFERRKTK